MIPQCIYCKHYVPFGDEYPWCIAYPKGIPDIIWNNEFDHTKHYAGDHGYMFELSNNLSPKEKELYDYVKKARERVE